MTEYRVIIHPGFRAQYEEFRRILTSDQPSTCALAARAGIRAMKAVRNGDEAKHRGERLGFSKNHYDLRDCAEIKIDVLDERYPDGRSRGPSHRLIYREFEPTGDDPRPIRQIIAFEHRKDGKPFEVAAERLGRQRGFAVPELAGVPNTVPATGRKKNPKRPTGPYRMPLPPDLAVALSTVQKALPRPQHFRSPDHRMRTADPPIRQPVRDR